MRILNLHVENFGTLHDFDDRFNEGLNLRLCPNGWGKTTLAAFIKAMLYGLPVSTTRSVLENERKRYTPWQGGAFGGSMDIEVEGKTYRLERFFGAKAAEDRLTITSLETGTPADVPWAKDPGIGLFGVDAAAYERSTHLSSQHPVKEKEGLDSIHAKLNHLTDAIDDLADCQAALDALEERRRIYVHMKGNNGLLSRERGRLEEYDDKIAACHARREQLDILRRTILETQRKSDAIACQLQALSEQQHKAVAAVHEIQIARGYARLESEMREVRERLESWKQELGGEIPAAETITQLRGVVERREHLRRKLEELSLVPGGDTIANEAQRYPRPWREEDAELLRSAAERWEREALRVQELAQPDAMQERYERLRARLGERIPDDRQWQEWRALCRAADVGQQTDFRQKNGSEPGSVPSKPMRLWWLPATVLGGLSLILSTLWTMRREFLYIGVAGLVAAGVLALVFGLRRGRVRQRQREQMQQKRRENRIRISSVLKRYGLSLSEEESAEKALESLQGLFTEYALLAEQIRQKEERRAQAEQELARAYDDWRRCFTAMSNDPVPRDRIRSATEALISGHSRWLSQCKQAEECEASLSDEQATLDHLLSSVPNCPREAGSALLWMTERRQSALECRAELERKNAGISAYAAEHPMQEERRKSLLTIQPPDLEGMERERSALVQEQERYTEELARLRQQEENLSEVEEEQMVLEDDRTACAARIEQMESTVKALENARAYLEKARVHLSTRYLCAMRERFGVYLSSVTGDEAPVFTMDGDLNVKLRVVGAERETACLSAGGRDLVTLCMRLALVDAMFAGEHPFLILDDPFVHLDDTRATRARALLNTLAERYQVLYLTCSESRS